MEDELTCCVCLELYTRPIILPCSHNLCESCVRNLLQRGRDAGSHRYLRCPKCRKEVKLDPRLGMRGLQENRILANIVQVFKEEKYRESKEVRRRKVCSHHVDKVCDRFCKSCSRYVCPQCVEGAHSGFGHVIDTIDTFVSAELARAQDSLVDLKQTMAQKQTLCDTLKSQRKALQDQQKDMLYMASQKIQLLSQALMAKQMEFEAQVCRETRHLRQPIDTKLEQAKLELEQCTQLLSNYEECKLEEDLELKLKNLSLLNIKLSSMLAFKSETTHIATIQLMEKSLPDCELRGLEQVQNAVANIHWSGLPKEKNEGPSLPTPAIRVSNMGARQKTALPSLQSSKIMRLHNGHTETSGTPQPSLELGKQPSLELGKHTSLEQQERSHQSLELGKHASREQPKSSHQPSLELVKQASLKEPEHSRQPSLELGKHASLELGKKNSVACENQPVFGRHFSLENREQPVIGRQSSAGYDPFGLFTFTANSKGSAGRGVYFQPIYPPEISTERPDFNLCKSFKAVRVGHSQEMVEDASIEGAAAAPKDSKDKSFRESFYSDLSINVLHHDLMDTVPRGSPSSGSDSSREGNQDLETWGVFYGGTSRDVASATPLDAPQASTECVSSTAQNPASNSEHTAPQNIQSLASRIINAARNLPSAFSHSPPKSSKTLSSFHSVVGNPTSSIPNSSVEVKDTDTSSSVRPKSQKSVDNKKAAGSSTCGPVATSECSRTKRIQPSDGTANTLQIFHYLAPSGDERRSGEVAVPPLSSTRTSSSNVPVYKSEEAPSRPFQSHDQTSEQDRNTFPPKTSSNTFERPAPSSNQSTTSSAASGTGIFSSCLSDSAVQDKPNFTSIFCCGARKFGQTDKNPFSYTNRQPQSAPVIAPGHQINPFAFSFEQNTTFQAQDGSQSSSATSFTLGSANSSTTSLQYDDPTSCTETSGAVALEAIRSRSDINVPRFHPVVPRRTGSPNKKRASKAKHSSIKQWV